MNAKNFTLTKTDSGYAFVSPGLKIPVKSLRTGGITIHEMITSGLADHPEALTLLRSLQEVDIPLVSHENEMLIARRFIDTQLEDVLIKECKALLSIEELERSIHKEVPFLPEQTTELAIVKTQNGIRFTGKDFISAELKYKAHALTFLDLYEHKKKVSGDKVEQLKKQIEELLKNEAPRYWGRLVN